MKLSVPLTRVRSSYYSGIFSFSFHFFSLREADAQRRRSLFLPFCKDDELESTFLRFSISALSCVSPSSKEHVTSSSRFWRRHGGCWKRHNGAEANTLDASSSQPSSGLLCDSQIGSPSRYRYAEDSASSKKKIIMTINFF